MARARETEARANRSFVTSADDLRPWRLADDGGKCWSKEVKSVTTTSMYPVKVNAQLDTRLSRGLWLVKWLLAIPH